MFLLWSIWLPFLPVSVNKANRHQFPMPSVEDKETHPSVAKMKFHPESMCCSGEEDQWSNVTTCLVAEFVFLSSYLQIQ